jgi:hypothetical protein
VWKVVTHADTEETPATATDSKPITNLYERAFIPAVIATASMLVMLFATVIWGVFVRTAMPQVFGEDWGLLQSSTAASLITVIVIMALSCALACFGLRHGWSARRSMA